ncbi:MAG TPA: hypothetical protein VGK48_10520 [Terriglobia bacterium]
MEFLAGSINGEHGIYKNYCCGDELVLYRGITFPNCNKHKQMITRWRLVGRIAMGRMSEAQGSGHDPNSGTPAA